MLLQTFETVLTDSFGKQSDLIDPEIRIQGFREGDFFFAGRLLADFTIEMKMPVFMGAFAAAVMAELIFRSGVFLNAVDNSFFLKCLQGAVNRGAVGIFKMGFHFG